MDVVSLRWAWLAAILLTPFLQKLARRRQAGQPVMDMEGVRSRVASAREPVAIAGLVVIVAVLACCCGALLAAGVTALLLSPQWLGGVLVAVAAACALAAVPEVRGIRRGLRARRLRLHGDDVTRELDGRPPT
jgi:UDP-N-acetylmuramyl pentapeptide phosphotransferase/UDP-N-acetylglucosamine-1-phosphate transferase